MKTRYKITAIAFSVLLGILFLPIVASNLYCDYISDSCTSRITGVGPGGVFLPAEWGTDDSCYVMNRDTGNMEPCRIDIGTISWPFPPRVWESEHDLRCDDICQEPNEKNTNRTVSSDDPVYSVPFGSSKTGYHVDPIYIENPNNPEELILDIDAMKQVQKILEKCDHVDKLNSGEIPAQNPDGSYNVVNSDLRSYENGTHYIDNNACEWRKIK